MRFKWAETACAYTVFRPEESVCPEMIWRIWGKGITELIGAVSEGCFGKVPGSSLEGRGLYGFCDLCKYFQKERKICAEKAALAPMWFRKRTEVRAGTSPKWHFPTKLHSPSLGKLISWCKVWICVYRLNRCNALMWGPLASLTVTKCSSSGERKSILVVEEVLLYNSAQRHVRRCAPLCHTHSQLSANSRC